MDALTRVLHILRLEPKVFHSLTLVSPWHLDRSMPDGAGFHVIYEGCCWLSMPGLDEPLALEAGDLIVVSNTAHYELLDRPEGMLRQTERFDSYRRQLTSAADRENRVTLLCTEFRAEQDAVSPLFSVMPPLILIRGENGRSIDWLTAPLEMVAFEAQHDYPGKDTVLSRLMDILFIMVIRYWITHQSARDGGWFSALYHPQIGEVLGYIHRQPEHEWTVDSLAEAVSMSRSSLANQFTGMVGESPMKYLTRWRMQLAATWLAQDPLLTVEEVSQRVGYTSSYAFSKAFKRLVGVAPSEYRSQAHRDGHLFQVKTAAPA